MPKTSRYKKLFNGFKKIWEEKMEGEPDTLKNEMIEKVLEKESVDESMKIEVEKYVGYMGLGNTIMVVSKNKIIKGLIENNFEMPNEPREYEKIKVLIQELYTSDEKEEIMSHYSMELLNKIFNIIKNYEVVTIKTKKNSPLYLEVNDLIFVLAPRSSDEIKLK